MRELPLIHFDLVERQVTVLHDETRHTFELGEMVLSYVYADLSPFYEKKAAPDIEKAAEVIRQLADVHVYFDLFAENLQKNPVDLHTYVWRYAAEVSRGLAACLDVRASDKPPLERYFSYYKDGGAAGRRMIEICHEDGKVVEYLEVGSIADLCKLEILMLANVSAMVKECRNCGRYFVLRGGYQTDFCSRVPSGETQTCQSLGAAKNYRRKVEDSPALRLYNKYYKRNYSRIRYGLMSREEFERWKVEAVVKREDCVAGRLAVEDFERWLGGV